MDDVDHGRVGDGGEENEEDCPALGRKKVEDVIDVTTHTKREGLEGPRRRKSLESRVESSIEGEDRVFEVL